MLPPWVQKRQPLPLSPQSYPLHGSEVNGAHPPGFHSGSSGYAHPNHTPPLNGTDSIMGRAVPSPRLVVVVVCVCLAVCVSASCGVCAFGMWCVCVS